MNNTLLMGARFEPGSGLDEGGLISLTHHAGEILSDLEEIDKNHDGVIDMDEWSRRAAG